jgi:hypothetical protein
MKYTFSREILEEFYEVRIELYRVCELRAYQSQQLGNNQRSGFRRRWRSVVSTKI